MTELEAHKAIDRLQAKLEEQVQLECPLHHVFTPMLYSRHILMPAGSLIVSKIHKYQHPFDIMEGVAWVKINEGGWARLQAPYSGITEPGTRRVLYIEENCWWKTSHVTDVWPENDSEEAIQEAVEKIEDLIIIKRENLIFNRETEMIEL